MNVANKNTDVYATTIRQYIGGKSISGQRVYVGRMVQQMLRKRVKSET